MRGPAAAENPPGPPNAVDRVDYTGAVYGSLLAASVVAGAGWAESFSRLRLVLLLLGTGVVFWAAHVFAHVFGERIADPALSREKIWRDLVAEWPIVKAAVPPALAVAVSPLLGLGPEGTLWLALCVAIAGQVGWATVAALRAGATGRLVLVAGAANLLLGLLVVLLKGALQH
ncbi:hypothetical protein [Streptomyces clavuligerus]|uniref:Putative integral membrane protein n=1 Tax=Streptomyces clavuligerus TaxID=1901 RepID=B5GLQ9_STRCL|nr:hypothetical protein [Streptomyces clavuligerus]EDY47255.1 integral membrane protein [Streptomyces clavuligerus]EFG04918.1 Putative integral membrane protein [Streptomyces clavuligerus]MBY6306645.1 hypothetical protein [Streptomyces clavuligerus]QCS10747.1 hypothetical protein CRV15_35095 [Streptomyces clavuligerus]QPJ97217.1 hypothetical protein GE265_29385 [Streptomyces clavuligerus]